MEKAYLTRFYQKTKKNYFGVFKIAAKKWFIRILVRLVNKQ